MYTVLPETVYIEATIPTILPPPFESGNPQPYTASRNIAQNVSRTTPAICRPRVSKVPGGTLRTHEALEAGIHPRTLYAMRDAGQLQRLTRGVCFMA
jgi:hypothetical protein